MGFFKAAELTVIRPPTPRVAQCGICGLHKNCITPKMPVSGQGRRKILVVGEAPGSNEDKEGIQFIGKAGSYLKKCLAKVGIDLRRDCWITNAAVCHPEGNLLPDRTIEYCRPNLIRAVEKLKPEVILLLGGSAVSSLIGWLWKEDPGGVNRWLGWRIPSIRLNAWVCPTWHPSFLCRIEQQRDFKVHELLFLQHLEAMTKLSGRPWRATPDYDSRIRLLYNQDEAAQAILRYLKSNVVAFDYETTRLKPDGDGARIVCCSVSDGETSIAYPWHGAAIKATKRLLLSDVGKVASNAKFECRWTLKEFGHGVNNWVWDTMLNGHIADNRAKISSVKFQAFIRLGVEEWDSHISPYLKSEGGNTDNRITEVSLPALLRYCAYDSLYEYLVANHQREEMGFPPLGED